MAQTSDARSLLERESGNDRVLEAMYLPAHTRLLRPVLDNPYGSEIRPAKMI